MLKLIQKMFFAVVLFFAAGILISVLLALVPDVYLDQTFTERFVSNVTVFVNFDYSHSEFGEYTLMDVILNRGVNSFSLIIMSLGCILLIGIPLGYFASMRKHVFFTSYWEKAIHVISSCPILIWALFFNFIFINNHILPTYDSMLEAHGVLKVVFFMLPALTVAIGDGILSDVIRMMKEATDKASTEEYLRVLRSRNVPVAKHLIRSLLPAVGSIISNKITYLIGGIVVVEYVFNWKGLGYQILSSISTTGAKNYNFVLGASVLLVGVVVFVHLLSDLATILSDPRIRTSQKI